MSDELDERTERFRALEATGQRMRANLACVLTAPPPDRRAFPMAGPDSPYDPGDAFGWNLPGGLVLSLWATPPYPPLTDPAAMPNPLGGFIGVPEGYNEEVARAVATSRPFEGLPLVWNGMYGAPLLFRWGGPQPAGQSWFTFVGAQDDLDDLFRRAQEFAAGYVEPSESAPGS